MTRPLFRRLFAPPVREQFDQEISLHRELLIEDYRKRGLSEADALVQADARLGDLGAVRQEAVSIGQRHANQERRADWWDQLRQDIRFALRSHVRQRGWTAVALITLALGIGASTAVFSVVNSLLLHPVPYPDGNRIVLLFESPNMTNGVKITVAPFGDALATWHGAKSFEAIESFTSSDMTRLDHGVASVARTSAISPTFLAFAGQHMLLGRNFTAADAIAGAPPIVMLSESVWRRDFGADPKVIGQTVLLDGSQHVIVGVAPRGLQITGPGPVSPDYWLPLRPVRDATMPSIGRLAPNVTIAMAQRELDTLAARAAVPSSKEFTAIISRPAETVSFRSSLLLLSGAVALVLLIACANVAHLLLARSASRQREFAIRAAIGAARSRLLRQLITEALALSIASCAVGIILGWVGLKLLISARPDGLAELDTATINGTVVAAAVAVSLITGVLFGLTGLLQRSILSPQSALKSGTASGGGRGQQRFRTLLVVSEMAMAATLLVGATLLVRSMIQLQQRNSGFDAHGLYAVNVQAPGLPEAASAALTRSLLERTTAIPGVLGTSLAQNVSPQIGVMFGSLELEGEGPIKSDPYISYNGVQSDYFAFLHIPLVEGRTFTDTTGASHEAIINRGMAAKYWPGKSAIGKQIRLSAKQPWMTIVGVTGDVAIRGSTSEASEPMLYIPHVDASRGTIMLRMRGDMNPMPAIRALMTSIDAHLPPPSITSVEDQMEAVLARPRFTMLLLTLFSVIAVLLASVGLYGVLAYAVAQRTREIGIRVALGASRGNVIRTVVMRGVALAAIGAAIGLVASHWATHALSHLLYGVPERDPLSLSIGAGILMLTAVLACIVPARRAVAIDPMSAIRSE